MTPQCCSTLDLLSVGLFPHPLIKLVYKIWSGGRKKTEIWRNKCGGKWRTDPPSMLIKSKIRRHLDTIQPASSNFIFHFFKVWIKMNGNKQKMQSKPNQQINTDALNQETRVGMACGSNDIKIHWDFKFGPKSWGLKL